MISMIWVSLKHSNEALTQLPSWIELNTASATQIVTLERDFMPTVSSSCYPHGTKCKLNMYDTANAFVMRHYSKGAF
jgi:hypothetical protein